MPDGKNTPVWLFVLFVVFSSEVRADIVLTPQEVSPAVCVTEAEASDLDGDGLVDLVALNVPVTGTKQLFIYPGVASGEFSNVPIVFSMSMFMQPWGLEIVDIDLDGIDDILVGGLLNNTVVAMIGDGNFGFSITVNTLPGSGGFDLVARDYSGDGLIDVLMPGAWDETLHISRGDGLGNFIFDSSIPIPNGISTVATGDIDQNGFHDMVVPHAEFGNTIIRVLRATAVGSYLPAEVIDLGLSGGYRSIELVDLNGDTFLDVAVPDELGGGILVLINDGAGGYGAPATYSGPIAEPFSLTSADLDLDGDIDLVMGGNSLSQSPTGIVVYENDGLGGFTLDAIIDSPDCYSLNTADINGDGMFDLLAANGPVNTVTPHLNETVTGGGPPPPSMDFIRADCNLDSQINIADAVNALSFLFMGSGTPDCVDACDSNDDGDFNIADPVLCLAHLFSGGIDPPGPFPVCGVDPTVDGLSCGFNGSCP
ncbi:MAG: FG-GAP-like repeat-containing protein [Planctomycetota bacterium]